jgi:hypothetical protein
MPLSPQQVFLSCSKLPKLPLILQMHRIGLQSSSKASMNLQDAPQPSFLPSRLGKWTHGPHQTQRLQPDGPTTLSNPFCSTIRGSWPSSIPYSLLKGHTAYSKPHGSLTMVSPLITNIMLRKKHGVVVFITNICYIFFLLRKPCLNCVVNIFVKMVKHYIIEIELEVVIWYAFSFRPMLKR